MQCSVISPGCSPVLLACQMAWGHLVSVCCLFGIHQVVRAPYQCHHPLPLCPLIIPPTSPLVLESDEFTHVQHFLLVCVCVCVCARVQGWHLNAPCVALCQQSWSFLMMFSCSSIERAAHFCFAAISFSYLNNAMTKRLAHNFPIGIITWCLACLNSVQ